MSIHKFILGRLKFAFATLLALTFFVVHPAADVSAKPKKAKYGTIKILTTPGGLLLTIDGKPRGETTTDYRAIRSGARAAQRCRSSSPQRKILDTRNRSACRTR